ncbi:MAG TPA: UDP-N-acetylmuramoyl-L-alanine--D-glutamate ligase [Longimicrobiaceae bacterium]|nr:UDP-N-acetylmuramoyl-L-alanine--D-glutamate ligase [Longimicrobiaceae bacterium]
MMGALAGQQVGILGLARSGLAAARLALAHGAHVYASDAAESAAVRESAELVRQQGGEAETGGHDLQRLAACDLIVLSPGIPPDVPLLRQPALAAVPVVAEVELAYRFLAAPIIAVTGTNGKTTTTALIAHLLQEAGIDAPAGGNIGTALSALALRDPPPRVAVVEVSSFQLGGIREFAPAIGLVTNLAPDHLDRYPSLQAYYADKARLFRNATPESRWVLNAEDAEVLALPGGAPGERYLFRVASEPDPDEGGGYLSAERYLTLRLSESGEERLLHATELPLLGLHNVANALAASIVARLAGADVEAISRGLRSFRAPPHRLQPVAERDGVLWINDSKATNIASTLVALRSMDRPTLLLLGGRHKGEPYTELLPELRGRVRCVLAFGEAEERVAADLEPHLPVERVPGSFDDVVWRAAELARPGDAVLLSPACSSYDMFDNYEERGRRFAELAARVSA